MRSRKFRKEKKRRQDRLKFRRDMLNKFELKSGLEVAKEARFKGVTKSMIVPYRAKLMKGGC